MTQKGTVQWFDSKKGYVFIEEKEQEIFIHYSEIQGEEFKNLEKGEKVELEVEKTENGLRAVKVVKL